VFQAWQLFVFEHYFLWPKKRPFFGLFTAFFLLIRVQVGVRGQTSGGVF
jgi:hypothetical protein